MAEFNSYLLGKARKSVGNITLCYTRGKNIAKAKVFARKDNPTPEILAQRARMKALVQLSRQLLPVIRKGFAGIGRGSAANAFVKVNMSRVSVDEANVATVDLERLLCASGMLYPPKVEVTYSEESKDVFFHAGDAGRGERLRLQRRSGVCGVIRERAWASPSSDVASPWGER